MKVLQRRLEGEATDIRDESSLVVEDPEVWLALPNDQLGGKMPQNLIGTPEEENLREVAIHVAQVDHDIYDDWNR